MCQQTISEAAALEISLAHQQELERCLNIVSNVPKKCYPFKHTKDAKNMPLTKEEVIWVIQCRKGDTIDLRGTDLHCVDLHGLYFTEALFGLTKAEQVSAKEDECRFAIPNLEDVDLESATLERAHMHKVRMSGAQLKRAHLEEADLSDAHLEDTNFAEAHLQKADLRKACLSGAYFKDAVLAGKDGVGPYVADAHWENCNLAFLDLSQVKMLGDEYEARQKQDKNGKEIEQYQAAVRACRKLALALESQGISEEASRFAYRAKLLQRTIYWKQHKLGATFFSLLLDVLAGYGCKPQRSLLAYIVVILGFMGLYLLNAQFAAPHLTWDEAIVLSLSSFHGRGFFPQNIALGTTYARLAVVEAVIGLFIEISFIATFTQRFFGK